MQNNSKQSQTTKLYPPVVSVLGHVDHGKTTLLDAIRKTNIVSGETGGITQAIGASEIEIMHEGTKRQITFIDTPGHEAFANMRSQGVSAADIVLLIVAADDGVMPQTKESIEKIKQAQIPYIAVITKIDMEGASVEKAKQQLLRENVLFEGLGGEVPFIGVSAKTGERIQDLLDLILLVYDVSHIKKNENEDFLGVVIEAKLDKRRGNVATVVVKKGMLNLGEKIYSLDQEVGKVRAIYNPMSQQVKELKPGEAGELLGLKLVLEAGTVLLTKPGEALLPEKQEQSLVPSSPHDLAQFFGSAESKTLSIVLKTETSGELEAIKNSLPEGVTVISEGQGDITLADVLLAKDLEALILGFKVGIAPDVKRLAESEKVFYKTYRIIYELLDEIDDVQAMISEEGQEVVRGRGTVLAEFPTNEGKILGIKVDEGRLAVGDDVRIVHGEKVIGESKIASIKRGKTPVKEAGRDSECGVTITPYVDFSLGDAIIAHNKKK